MPSEPTPGPRRDLLDLVVEDLALGGEDLDGELLVGHDRLVLLLARGLDDVVDRALEQERRLRHVVVLAVEDLLEAADRLGDRHVLARRARELLGDVERLRQEALDARARPTMSLSSSESSSMPRIAMMSWSSL
jgi:hypothetical protein